MWLFNFWPLFYFFVQISVFSQWIYISKMVTISPQIKLVSLYCFLSCLSFCLFVCYFSNIKILLRECLMFNNIKILHSPEKTKLRPEQCCVNVFVKMASLLI